MELKLPIITPGYFGVDGQARNRTSMRLSSLFRYLLGSEQAFEHKEQLILRDHLALVRTRLANETALLSYIRSSLYLLIGGIALVQVGERVGLHYVGYLALLLSAGFVLIGLYRYYTLRRHLNRYYTRAMQAVLKPDQVDPGK